MDTPGWHRVPGDEAQERYWDGRGWPDVRPIATRPIAGQPTLVGSTLGVAPTVAVVPDPLNAGAPTETMATVVVPAEPVKLLAEEGVRDPSRGALIAIALVIVGALIALVVWLAGRNSDPDKPYSCGSGVSVVDWNSRTFTLTNGSPPMAEWPAPGL